MEGLRSIALSFLLVSTLFRVSAQQATPAGVQPASQAPSGAPIIIVDPPFYPQACYYYGYGGSGPYAYACANSNGNQPSGSLSLNNVANINWDPSTGSFTSNSNTDNTASGNSATINSNTNANAFAPASPQSTYYAQVNGNANSNGQSLTGNLNNLDLTNSLGQPAGPLSVQSSSSVNGTGTGVTLSSNANANGNAYATSTATPYITYTTPCMTCTTHSFPTAVPLPAKSVQHKKIYSGVVSRILRKKPAPVVAPAAKRVLRPVSAYHRSS